MTTRVDRSAFEARARGVLGDTRLRRDAPLAPLTTFKVGGPADWLADVNTADELRQVLEIASDAGLAVAILGGGSNVIIADQGVRGLVLRLHLTGISQPSSDEVRADAGVMINGLVRWTIGRGLAGVEAWAGTPGTVGGAIHGNAHWQGQNIGELVRRVRVISSSGETTDLGAGDMAFGYDASRLQRTHEILVWADVAVSPGDPSALRERARRSLAFRKRTQPLAMASAGCVFQNPDPSRDRVPEGFPASAGALVDRAGLKGLHIGGARISETHANFVVNEGTATAADIRALIETARGAVEEKFGVTLRDEVVYVGTF